MKPALMIIALLALTACSEAKLPTVATSERIAPCQGVVVSMPDGGGRCETTDSPQ